MSTIRVMVVLCALAMVPRVVVAQDTPQLPAGSPFRGGVPSGNATADTLSLSVADVLRRALDNNLGVITSEEAVDHASGTRRTALAELLPNLSASLTES